VPTTNNSGICSRSNINPRHSRPIGFCRNLELALLRAAILKSHLSRTSEPHFFHLRVAEAVSVSTRGRNRLIRNVRTVSATADTNASTGEEQFDRPSSERDQECRCINVPELGPGTAFFSELGTWRLTPALVLRCFYDQFKEAWIAGPLSVGGSLGPTATA